MLSENGFKIHKAQNREGITPLGLWKNLIAEPKELIRIVKKELHMSKRPPTPSKLKRRILVEAGHRCAIPTCRQPTTEIAHIEPWSKVKEHKYENLIALCPNCHTRADKGEIDRKSLRIYKRILQRLTDRYDRFELNVLNELRLGRRVNMAGNMLLLIKNLLDEELVITREGISRGNVALNVRMGTIPINVQVFLTEKGEKFIKEWMEANEELTY